jgi:hypothetical protein
MMTSDSLLAEATQHYKQSARLLVKAAHQTNPAERSRLIACAYVYAGMGDNAESLGQREQAREAGITEYGRGPRR